MHEVGHTLGLRHNFKSSWIYDAKDIHDTSITGKSHIGSVMDYDPINIAPEELSKAIISLMNLASMINGQ